MGLGKVVIVHPLSSDCSALKSLLSRERYDVMEAPVGLGMTSLPLGDYCMILIDYPSAGAAAVKGRAVRSPALNPANPQARTLALPKVRSMQHKRLSSTFKLGDKTVLLAARTIRGPSDEIHLTRLESNILSQLRAHANRTVPSEDLVRTLWPFDPGKGVHSLRAFIKNLRKKIEPDPAQPRYIITDLARGYRLQVPSSPEVASDISKLPANRQM